MDTTTQIDRFATIREAQASIRQLETEARQQRDKEEQAHKVEVSTVLSKLLTLCGIEVVSELTTNDLTIDNIRFWLAEHGTEYRPSQPKIGPSRYGYQAIWATLNISHVLTDEELSLIADVPTIHVTRDIYVNGLDVEGDFTYIAAQIADAIDEVNAEYKRFTEWRAAPAKVELPPCVVLEYRLEWTQSKFEFQQDAARLIKEGYRPLPPTCGQCATESGIPYSVVSALFILTND